jgi:hypothetical protein
MPTSIPTDPDALLPREHTAAALRESGFPITRATLATKATRGGGPPYRLFGVKPLYRWGDALAWAQARLSAPRCSSSEGDAIDQTAPAAAQDPVEAQPEPPPQPERRAGADPPRRRKPTEAEATT